MTSAPERPLIEKTPIAKTPIDRKPESQAPRQDPQPTTPPVRRESSKERIRERIRGLQSTSQGALQTLRELWEVEAELIPELILELENPAPTQVFELKILILDKELFAKKNVGLDAKGQVFVYEIPGMGTLAYDDIATGPARGNGVKVIVKRFKSSAPFTVGEALRAALLNRFRSSNYPPADHRSNLIGWWQRYYEQVRQSL